ncbi:MAG: hypothetical protein COW89_09420 [Nitrospinae bacterium CG22_combo_CG10-13_8_21_14_all_47_10]|nr:MAG: hypothetical protein COW89_09420 [Nitrospinae bacterium CG22_combo_CG10-13_8_21_14_all_47_10]
MDSLYKLGLFQVVLYRCSYFFMTHLKNQGLETKKHFRGNSFYIIYDFLRVRNSCETFFFEN